MEGKVSEILVAQKAGGELYSTPGARLEKGKGIVGDRYYLKQGTFSDSLIESGDFEVTLIEEEQIASFNRHAGLDYRPADFRRNIVTINIRLADLVEKEFYLGDTKLYATRLCEPCAYLANILGNEIMQHMVHKAGIRAKIIDSGDVNVLDVVKLTLP